MTFTVKPSAVDVTDPNVGTGDGLLIVNVIVAVADSAPDEPVTVTLADEAVLGVPDTTPVAWLICSPLGNEPLVTVYVTAPVKPVGVNAVDGDIAVPDVPDTVCVLGDKD